MFGRSSKASGLLVILMLISSPVVFPMGAMARIIREINVNGDEISRTIPGFSKLPSVVRERLHIPQRSWSLPVFQEAPAFRNGKECVLTTPPWMAMMSSENHGEDEEEEELCDSNAVHIAMTLDAAYLRGVVAGILSILQHAACPENVVFHFMASDKEADLKDALMATFPYLRFKLYHFDENIVKDKISYSIRQALDQPLNYARSYLANILPGCVGRIIYLDSDLVVVDDIAKLWQTSLESHILAAPEYCHANFTKYFTDEFWTDPDLSQIFQGKKSCYFNTGVMVIDLVKWRQGSYTLKIEEWMEVQKKRRIYELGSLPPFLLVFAGQVEAVDHRWNQHGLGGDNFEGRCRDLHPGPVSLLHWSGKGKPWLRLDLRQSCPLDSLWAPYDLFQSASFVH